MNPWLVVPTMGNRNGSLRRLLRDSGMPSVVVHTGPVIEAVGETKPIVDQGEPINIQRWWNGGIDKAVECGADVVVVVNDDVRAGEGALIELAKRIQPDQYGSPALAWLHDPQHAEMRVTPITGYCFALDPQRIRPDEAFKWWYGDNDLELRARALNPAPGVISVTCLDVEHLRVDCRYDRPVQHLIQQDRVLFRERYPGPMSQYLRRQRSSGPVYDWDVAYEMQEMSEGDE